MHIFYNVFACWKNALALGIALASALSASSQTRHANEWMIPGEAYYKISVATNGIYRVSFESLVAAGMENTPFPSADIALFNFGQERPIYISNPVFGPGEFIEFYGEKHTIGLDTFLYEDWEKDLFNTEFSLVTDTNAYFFARQPGIQHKRIQAAPLPPDLTSRPQQPWYWRETKTVFSDTYFKNKYGEIIYSQLEPSEGFGSGLRSLTLVELATPFAYVQGPSPVITFRTGQLSIQSVLDVRWNGDLLGTSTLPPSRTAIFQYEPGWAGWSTSNALTLKNAGNTNDKHTLGFVSVTYPAVPDAASQPVFTGRIPQTDVPSVLTVTALNSSRKHVIVHDHTRHLRWDISNWSGPSLLIPLDVYAGSRNITAADIETGVVKPAAIRKFMAREFRNTSQTYIILTSERLRKGPDGDAPARYAAYRSSPAGGNFNTEIINIEDVYNQFGYGIDRHFMAVKNLARFMKEKWPTVTHVILLGKAIEYPFIRKASDITNYYATSFFIPTYGYLGSDNMLFSEGNFPDPYFAIGRIAARSGREIDDYLDKVKEYETAPSAPQKPEDKYWMKRVLHLGGGKNISEQAAIRLGLETMEDIIRDTIFGGDVFAYYKKSADEVQFSVNEEINRLFTGGLSIINFFGHSASSSWDFSIENPRNYDNFGRYPIIHSFGCYSGNLHGPVKGISEAFVLEKNRGSISFLATTGTAFIPSLSYFGAQLHQIMFNSARFSSEGEAIRLLIEKNRTARLAELALYSQLTLHGDPAIRPYLSQDTDYTWDNQQSKVQTDPILSTSATFTATLELVNLGAYIQDSLRIRVLRQLPSGKIADTLHIKIPGVANRVALPVTFPTYGSEGVGRNILFAEVDPENQLSEGPAPDAEGNNQLGDGGGLECIIRDNLARPVFPPDFGIVGDIKQWILRASTTSAPLEKTKYILQLDTSRYFSSPLGEISLQESTGGLVEYTPVQAPKDGTVYYWRISPDTTTGERANWAGASFIYLSGNPSGWNQSHFFQYLQNPELTLDLSEETGRQFEMGKNNNLVKFRNKTWDLNDRPGFTFNNVTFGSVAPWVYLDAGIAFVRYNGKTGQFYRNAVGGEYGSLNPTSGSIAVYPFRTSTPQERKNVIDFAEKIIQEGEFITFFTVVRDTAAHFFPEDWAGDEQLFGKSIFSVLESWGATKIRQLSMTGSTPYFVQLYRDNKRGKVLQEELASDDTEIIENTTVYTSFTSSGIIKTELIGPASSWQQVSTQWRDVSPTARHSVYVYASDGKGKDILTDSILGTGQLDLQIDVKEYPYLRLLAKTSDTLQKEAGQLVYWRTSFEPLPDLAVRFVSLQPDPTTSPVSQGQALVLEYEIINAGSVVADSTQIRTGYTGPKREWVYASEPLPALAPGTRVQRRFNCTAPIGEATRLDLFVEANPGNLPAERYRFNNLISQSIPLKKDNKNPQLQVLFDGVRILDGDIVSPKPEIALVLRDENTFLPITDPSVFDIKLDTGRNEFIDIPINSPDLQFIAASPSQPVAKMLYRPVLSDGTYTLSVQGKDAAGNLSGKEPYVVTFRVVNESGISNMLNYPNPFSTSTQFVFTLTGDELPDEVSIVIMTVSGKIIREITADEIGPLRTGINRTEYKWDGTDEFGEKVANGVYLYKMQARHSSGKSLNALKNQSIDSFFTKGIGKMVLLR